MKKTATVALAALAVSLAGCGTATHPVASTVTVTAPATVTVTAAAPTALPAEDPATPVAFAYGPRGAYAVGEARGGLTQAIPLGRYRIEGINGQGFLKQCGSVLSDMSATDHVIENTITESGVPTIVEIAPTVVAIYLFDANLTPLE